MLTIKVNQNSGALSSVDASRNALDIKAFAPKPASFLGAVYPTLPYFPSDISARISGMTPYGIVMTGRIVGRTVAVPRHAASLAGLLDPHVAHHLADPFAFAGHAQGLVELSLALSRPIKYTTPLTERTRKLAESMSVSNRYAA